MVIFNLCKLTTFAYLDCSIFLICCSGLVWESFPTNKVSVAILSRLGDFGLRLTGLREGSRQRALVRNDSKRQPYPGNDGKVR